MDPFYQRNNVILYHGDCLEVMPYLASQGAIVDLCLTDVPYGITACKWDVVIPIQPMWDGIHSLVKKTGAVCLFASQPFASTLVTSNPKEFKYCWFWVKKPAVGFQHAQNRPLYGVEEICVFSKAPMGHKSQLGDRRMSYFPQGIVPAGRKVIRASTHGNRLGARLNQVGLEYDSYTGFQNNVLECNSVSRTKGLHATQKPLQILEYLIRCYTKEGDMVLDFTAGSGSTGEACINTGRKCIMIEKEEALCNVIATRIQSCL